jgi:hypothetical protein
MIDTTPIGPRDSCTTLHDHIASAGGGLLAEMVEQLAAAERHARVSGDITKAILLLSQVNTFFSYIS